MRAHMICRFFVYVGDALYGGYIDAAQAKEAVDRLKRKGFNATMKERISVW